MLLVWSQFALKYWLVAAAETCSTSNKVESLKVLQTLDTIRQNFLCWKSTTAAQSQSATAIFPASHKKKSGWSLQCTAPFQRLYYQAMLTMLKEESLTKKQRLRDNAVKVSASISRNPLCLQTWVARHQKLPFFPSQDQDLCWTYPILCAKSFQNTFLVFYKEPVECSRPADKTTFKGSKATSR